MYASKKKYHVRKSWRHSREEQQKLQDLPPGGYGPGTGSHGKGQKRGFNLRGQNDSDRKRFPGEIISGDLLYCLSMYSELTKP